jgi:hypothetical protein
VGYDVDFIQIPRPSDLTFPVEPAQARELLRQAAPITEEAVVREALLKLTGCKPGPNDTIDFLGRGLSYARLSILNDRIHVENNCSANELLKVHGQLNELLPGLLIYDLQSRQLHSAESFAAWWAKPL